MLKRWFKTSSLALATALATTTSLFGQCSLFDNWFCAPYCEDGPLAYGAFSLEFKAGVQPTHYSGRGTTFLYAPTLLPPVVAGPTSPKFRSQFGTPWQVGLEAAWNASTHLQVFFEYDYVQASGRSDNFTFGGIGFSRGWDDYKVNSIYLGSRYYFGHIWCSECWGNVAPFVGFKGGILWQDTIRYGFEIGGTPVGSRTAYFDQLAVSAGLQIGAEWFYDCHWSVALNGELVATQGLRNNRNIDVSGTTVTPVTNINLGPTGKLISFPVTLGIRYTF